MSTQAFAIVQGDSFEATFACQQPDGTAQDLTGCTITWACAQLLPGVEPSAYLTKTSGDGITVIDAVAGTCRLVVGKGEIIHSGPHEMELRVEPPGGARYTQMQALFGVRASLIG